MKFKAKNEHNPDGYGHFLTQKFDKKAIFRTILPYLAVANTELILFYCAKITYSVFQEPFPVLPEYQGKRKS